MGLDNIANYIQGCKLCPLHKGRTHIVLGSGPAAAGILIVGEAPGANEDAQGVPFIGRAGQSLDAALARIGRDRWREVYVTNAVKCRPPGNANPSEGEMGTCRPYLEEQIKAVNPNLIVAVGRIATYQLLGKDDPLKNLRGQVFQYIDPHDGQGCPVIVMYHPAYILRNRKEVGKWKEDWLFVEKVYKNLCIEKVKK